MFAKGEMEETILGEEGVHKVVRLHLARQIGEILTGILSL